MNLHRTEQLISRLFPTDTARERERNADNSFLFGEKKVQASLVVSDEAPRKNSAAGQIRTGGIA